MIIWPAKRQDEILDYSWNPPLENGEHIVTHSITLVSGSSLIDGSSHNNFTVTVWLSNGTADTVFELTATTEDGRTYQTTAVLQVAPEHDADIAAFLAAFPSFAGVSDATLDFWLGRAQGAIDSSWSEHDKDFAGYLLAAHYLTLNGLGTGAEAELAANGVTGMTRLKSGAFEISLANVESKGAYGGTSYGLQFQELLHRNKGGPIVTGGGVFCC